jgi:hypothetical protein
MAAMVKKLLKVAEVQPLFVSFDDAARASGLAKKTLQNLLSLGQLPVMIRYAGSKPLIEFKSLQRWLDSLPTEPERRRGRRPSNGT